MTDEKKTIPITITEGLVVKGGLNPAKSQVSVRPAAPKSIPQAKPAENKKKD